MEALEGALMMVEMGMPVFPLWGVIVDEDERVWDLNPQYRGEPASHSIGSGKRPKGRWKEMATTDPEVIRDWFEEDPHANYGVKLGAGWMVVDCDSDEAVDSFEGAWVQFNEGQELRTMWVVTAKGIHYYFKGQSQSFKLPPATDVKAEGGYVVGPGSRSWNGSTYRLGETKDVWPAQPWFCDNSRLRETAQGSGEPFRLVQGNRNNQLIQLAGRLIHIGVDRDLVKETLLRINERSDEALAVSEIEETVFRSVDKWAYGQDLQSLVDFEAAWDGISVDEVTERRFLETADDRKLWPKPTWMVEGVLPDRGLWQMYGASYTGKTFAAIDLALSLTNGKPWMGFDIQSRRDHVLYILAEGGFDFQERVNAWCTYHGGDDRKLITITERPLDLATAEDWVKIGKEIMDDERVAAVRDKLGLIVLDTQSMLLGVEENDNRSMSTAANLLRSVSNKLNCPIMTVHHAPYTGGGGRMGGRGASSFGAAMDVIMEITMRESTNTEMRVLNFRKVKGARLPTARPLFELVESESSATVFFDPTIDRLQVNAEGYISMTKAFLRTQPRMSQTWAHIRDYLGLTHRDYEQRDSLIAAYHDLEEFEIVRERNSHRITLVEVPGTVSTEL